LARISEVIAIFNSAFGDRDFKKRYIERNEHQYDFWITGDPRIQVAVRTSRQTVGPTARRSPDIWIFLMVEIEEYPGTFIKMTDRSATSLKQWESNLKRKLLGLEAKLDRYNRDDVVDFALHLKKNLPPKGN
jgi:hypothetical protein